MKKMIKLIGIVVVVALLQSCNGRDYGYEISSVNPVKIDSVKWQADTMTVLMTQEIKTYSNYQEGCEGFYGYDYQKEDMNRKVISYKFKTEAPCGNSSIAGWDILRFRPEKTGTYTFKFWQGKDASDHDIWLEKNIVVIP